MMRHAAAALATVVLIAGCAPSPAVVVTGEEWRAELTWTSQPVALRPVTLRLRFVDAAGRPLAVGDLSAKANMPEMDHGAETVRFLPTADGVFEAAHTFSMDGAWMIRAEWQSGARRESAQFRIEVGDR
jgi:nitrogen fixation protein FixH